MINPNRLHWRVAYSLDVYYHIIASTNVPNNSMVQSVAAMNGGFNPANGMASILQSSPAAPHNFFPHIFVPGGNALAAMNAMIAVIDQAVGHHHLEPIIKF